MTATDKRIAILTAQVRDLVEAAKTVIDNWPVITNDDINALSFIVAKIEGRTLCQYTTESTDGSTASLAGKSV